MSLNEATNNDLELDLFAELSPSEKQASKMIAKIAINIFDARKRLGMNQKQFAKHLGVSQGMISKWESANYNFTLETLTDIFQKLNLSFNIEIEELAKVNSTAETSRCCKVSDFHEYVAIGAKINPMHPRPANYLLNVG